MLLNILRGEISAKKTFVCILLGGLFFSCHVAGVLAGKHCGAEGDWRSDIIPDRWPPPKARRYFSSTFGRIRMVSMSKACAGHDKCYDTLGVTRDFCDNQFLRDMNTECDQVYTSLLERPIKEACHFAAKGYYKAVQENGSEAFKVAQKNSLKTHKGSGKSPPNNPVIANNSRGKNTTSSPRKVRSEARKAENTISGSSNSPLMAIQSGPGGQKTLIKKENTGSDVSGGLLFENSDFEHGDLTNWTVSGDAFRYQPTKGDNITARRKNQSAQHQGEYWVGTYEKFRGLLNEKIGDRQGDKPTGSLHSQSFIIQEETICFLIGGGRKDTALFVSLVINDKEVLRTTGNNSEKMRRETWDVSEYMGQTAHIEIEDRSSGGWGHINTDNFRYMKF